MNGIITLPLLGRFLTNLRTEIANLYLTKESGKGLSTNDFTDALKNLVENPITIKESYGYTTSSIQQNKLIGKLNGIYTTISSNTIINPFEQIAYLTTTSTSTITDAYVQCTADISYLGVTLTTNQAVYLKATPNSGTATIIGVTQSISNDGKIYIYLGLAKSSTTIELHLNHPIFWYKNDSLIQYTGLLNFYYAGAGSEYGNIISNDNKYTDSGLINVTCSDKYLFVVSRTDFKVFMSGIEVPTIVTGTTTIDNITYNIIRSNNKYTGTFNIEVKCMEQ